MCNDYLVKIGDIATVFDGPHATPTKIEHGPYFLSISSLEAGQLDLSKSARLSEEQFDKWTRRVTPQEGDVLFSYETRLGEAALMPKGVKACLGRRMGLLRPALDKVLPDYLLYAYMSPMFQQEIKKRTIHGATVDRISLKELPDFNIRIPPLSEQARVVNVLKSLNQKLSLNRQINQTLEQMAQTLFKSWFVDFDPVIDNALDAGNPIPDELQHRAEARKAVRESEGFKPLPDEVRQLFPDAFEESELGWVPKGWVASDLNEIATVLSGFAFKSKDFQDTGLGVIKIKNIGSDKSVDIYDIQRIDEAVGLACERFRLKDGDLLMAMTGATVGKFGSLVTENGETYYLNQRVAKLVPKDASSEYLYCALNRDKADAYIVNAAQGSAQPNISARDILAMPLIAAPKHLRELFNAKVNDSFKQIIQLRKQVITLTKLRDTLLPKLISGELRLDEIEAAVEQETVGA
ncbi:restriction endonuclease subunit S [Vibrio cholerae]|uniref:restriction endonuclease subunit S n=1 Tax=Vibrio cholerae TaxID=666 RepID=UPI0028DA6906|nr:restriction endonuclease subunit S [Vibrio cholerae]